MNLANTAHWVLLGFTLLSNVEVVRSFASGSIIQTHRSIRTIKSRLLASIESSVDSSSDENHSAKRTRVVIAGAGPAGLLAAHMLLSRGDNFDVKIFESNPDPRFTPPGPRSYSLGLNLRGQSAIKYFEQAGRCKGLWEDIASQGKESDSFFLHFGSRRFQIRKPAKANQKNKDTIPPTVLLQRNILCAAMYKNLLDQYGDSGRCEVVFKKRVADVSLDQQQVKVEPADTVTAGGNAEIVPYDLLIGSDGVRSAVRTAMDKHVSINSSDINRFYSEEVLLPGMFKVMIQEFPEGLDQDAVHAVEPSGKVKANYSLFLIPTSENKTCVLVSTRRANIDEEDPSSMPLPLRQYASPVAIQRDIEEKFPVFGKASNDAIKQLLQQRPSEVRTVRCNRYHATSRSGGGVLLLGDAAHSTGGTLGQGANSALLDVVALDQCLDECVEDNIAAAVARFSERQVPEGLALWQLLQLPPKGPMGILYQISQFFWGFWSNFKALKRVLPQPTQNLLSQSLTPFSEIVRRNKFWVRLATKPFCRVQYTPESSTTI